MAAWIELACEECGLVANDISALDPRASCFECGCRTFFATIIDEEDSVALPRELATSLGRSADETVYDSLSAAPVEKGYRAAGKARMSLLPGAALRVVAHVLTIGGERHGARGWESCSDPSLYLDAAERHLSRLHDGEWIDGTGDDPTHRPHVACAIADLLIYLALQLSRGAIDVDQRF